MTKTNDCDEQNKMTPIAQPAQQSVVTTFNKINSYNGNK